MHKYRIPFIALFVIIMAFASQSHAEASITVDHIDGLRSGDTVWTNTPITFWLRFRNFSGAHAGGVTNGWRVWTHRNGAFTDSFSPIAMDTLPMPGGWSSMFDLIVSVGYHGVDGVGADSVKLGAASISGTGYYNGFDRLTATITTILDTPGDTLCLDSSFLPPGAIWLWSTFSGNVIPDWDGPHCFHVIEACCSGSWGNVNQQGDVDISDLTMLVDYIFPPHTDVPCLGAGNVNGEFLTGLPADISDVMFLVAYLFLGGPAPPECP